MSKRSRLPWLILSGIIFLVIHIAALFPFQSITPTGKYTGDHWHLCNGFCGANRSSTLILHGRNQRPGDTALVDPSPGYGQYLHFRETLPNSGTLSTVHRKECLMPARVRAGPLAAFLVEIRLRWLQRSRMVRIVLRSRISYCKFFLNEWAINCKLIKNQICKIEI